MPLNPYFAHRSLIIRISDWPHDDEESLHTVHILDVPHAGESWDELVDTLTRILAENEIDDGFYISDRRSIFQAGDSASSQEVEVTIWQGKTRGSVEGALGGILGWAAAKYGQHRKSKGLRAGEGYRPQPASVIHGAKNYFGETGDLTLEDEDRGKDSYQAVIRDSLGRRFRVESDDEGRETIRKLP